MRSELEILPLGIAVVRPAGRLDLTTAAELKQQIAQTIGAGHAYVVVDLAEVAFIDSSGLGILIGSLKAARLAQGDLRIACANQQARTVLELTTLERILRPYPTVEEALEQFGQPADR